MKFQVKVMGDTSDFENFKIDMDGLSCDAARVVLLAASDALKDHLDKLDIAELERAAQ